MVRDIVLIHSTGQGAAGWERVVHALTERGRTAHVVELPSDPELLAAGYAGLIRRQVGAVAAPIVLAHSGAARCSQRPHARWGLATGLARGLGAGPGGELRRGDRPPRAGRLRS
jgi:hypothetical protein